MRRTALALRPQLLVTLKDLYHSHGTVASTTAVKVRTFTLPRPAFFVPLFVVTSSFVLRNRRRPAHEDIRTR